jgi:hypothetical protein
MARVTRTITGSNQFTDPVKLSGYFNLSVSGSWLGTITVQRSFDLGSTWFDVAEFTTNTEEYGLEPEHTNVVLYRAGAKTDKFNGTNCTIRLSQ